MKRLFVALTVVICLSSVVVRAEIFSERIDALNEYKTAMQQWSSLRFDAEVSSEILDLSEAVLYNGEFVKNGNKLLYDHTRFSQNTLEMCREKSKQSIDVCHARMIRVGGNSYTVWGLGDSVSIEQTIAPEGSNALYKDTPDYAFQKLAEMIDAINEISEKNPAWLDVEPTEDDEGVLTYRLTWGANSFGNENIYILKFDSHSNTSLPLLFQVGSHNLSDGDIILNSELKLKLTADSPLQFEQFTEKSYRLQKQDISLMKFWTWFDLKKNITMNDKWSLIISSDVEINGSVFPEEMQFVVPKGGSLVVYDFTQDDVKPKIFEAADRQIVTP